MNRLTPAVPAGLLSLGLLIIGYMRGPTLDASVFAVIANELRYGAMPYRDLFDHKPPGIYILEALLGHVLPAVDGWTRAWLLTTTCTLVTFTLLAWILVPRVGALATAIGLLVLAPLTSADLVALGGGYTEPVAMLPALLAMLLALRPGRLAAAATGVALAASVTVSFQTAPAGVAIVLMQIWGRTRTETLVTLSASVGAASVIAAWLLFADALPAAIDALVYYNRSYVEQNDLLGVVPLTAMASTALIGSPALGAIAFRIASFRSVRPDALQVGAVAWLLGWMGVVLAQQNFFPHYALAIVPPSGILACHGIAQVLRALRSPNDRIAATMLLGLSAVPASLGVAVTERGVHPPGEIAEAALAVSALTDAEERILVWGSEPEVYLLSARRPSTRYVYFFPLLQPGYTGPALVGRFLDELAADPPAAVVDASYNPGRVGSVHLILPSAYPPGLIDDRGLLDPVRVWIQEHYEPAPTGTDWAIYVPKAKVSWHGL